MFTQHGIFEGHFKNGEPNGKCRLINERLCMEAEFVTIIPSSKSYVTISWKNKADVFEGVVNASSFMMKGTLSLASGEVHYGQFKYQETIKHGVVKSISIDGAESIAEWRDD